MGSRGQSSCWCLWTARPAAKWGRISSLRNATTWLLAVTVYSKYIYKVYNHLFLVWYVVIDMFLLISLRIDFSSTMSIPWLWSEIPEFSTNCSGYLLHCEAAQPAMWGPFHRQLSNLVNRRSVGFTLDMWYVYVDLFLDGVINVIKRYKRYKPASHHQRGPLPVGSYGWFFIHWNSWRCLGSSIFWI